jgi:hypothetical protein
VTTCAVDCETKTNDMRAEKIAFILFLLKIVMVIPVINYVT